MRATSRFLLLGALAMCLSACLPEPPMGSDAAIFKRPSRYGWGASGGRPTAAAPEQSTQQRGSTNRFGHTENKRKPNTPGSNSSQGSNSNSDGGSSSRSDSGSNSNDDPASTVAADDDKKNMSDSGDSSGSSSSGDSSESNQSSSSTPPSNLNAYPYARLVPGKKGYVTLPGANAGVGEIDVTGIKPGTPVEINDPRDPSKKIYFRVP